MTTAQSWIQRLHLAPHPEGGWFRETYRSGETIPMDGLPGRYDGPRAFSTAIYFLLQGDQMSALHRIASDEVWHFYAGSSLTLFELRPDGTRIDTPLGPDPDRGQTVQAVIPAGSWFGARVDDPRGFTLLGCTVAPGFDFSDFELARRSDLIRHFPHHRDLITSLTPGDPE